jgi:tRNA(adenine34) deaminase
MDIEIRVAAHSDSDDIVGLWIELMTMHADLDPRFAIREDAATTFADFALDIIDGADSEILCAWSGDRIVGFISVAIQVSPPVLRLEQFGMVYDAVVTQELRRAGVGAQLFDAAKDWFRRRGVDVVQLSVATTNPVATGFWRKVGCVPFMERLWYDLK